MARAFPLVASFNAGEWTPRLVGRPDLERYAAACRRLRNAIPTPWGPAERRPGFRFVAEVKNSAHDAILLPFIFSTTQAYIIEAGDQYFRYYKDLGRIESGGSPVETVTPYAHDELGRLKWTQSADTLYLPHPFYAPRTLTRSSHTVWTLAAYTPNDGPYLEENTTSTTLTPSAATGAITLTASAVTGINDGAGFLSTDVGRIIRLKEGSTWGWVTITGWTSTTVVTATVNNTLTNTNAKTAWRMGLWSHSYGWPSCAQFHEQRLFWAGAGARPQRVDGSATGNFTKFVPGTDDADPVSYSIDSDKVNAIRWLASRKVLHLGTVGAEARVGSVSATTPLTPSNVQAKIETDHGSADMMAVGIGNVVIFAQYHGRKLREMAFVFEDDGYRAPDISRLAEHLFLDGIAGFVYQQEPWSCIWVWTATGDLLSCTYVREEGVVAWAKHPVGGNGIVESLACIPGTNGYDELWAAIRRTIDGQTRLYVEVLTPAFDDGVALEDGVFVDSSLSYNGTATTTLSGLSHLEGQTVQIMTNRGVHPAQMVLGGTVQLEWPVTKAHVGLAYTTTIQPMPLEAGGVAGTSQGARGRIDEIVVRLHRSLGCKIGRDDAHLDVIPFRIANDDMDEPPPVFTGDRSVKFRGDNATTREIVITQELPLPLQVLSIMPRVSTHAG